MRYGSVCSGIEAASVAWEPLGWKPAWFSEIEKFPSAVLASHWPDVVNLGDMTKIADAVKAGVVEAPDVLVGGTPCQAFSVAGLRNGLSDARGQLTLSYVELADAIDDKRRERGEEEAIIVWENVPGVLNTKDNAFGCFISALAGEDGELQPSGEKWTNSGCVYGPKRIVAWRTLDAQFFRVAQRRRRVFIVASARKGFDPAAVLFEFESLRRDTPPSRSKKTDVTTFTGKCAQSGNHWDNTINLHPTLNQSPNAGVIGANNQDIFSQQGSGLVPSAYSDISRTLLAKGNDSTAEDLETYILAYGGGKTGGNIDVATTCTAHGSRLDFDTETFAVHGTQDPVVNRELAQTLGRNNGQENCCIAFSYKDHGADATVDMSPTLRAGNSVSSHANGGQSPAIAISGNMQVRRLTPVECERLQGFSDKHTQIAWRGKDVAECPDGPRYKAIGNSMAVPVMRWLGEQIAAALPAPMHKPIQRPFLKWAGGKYSALSELFAHIPAGLRLIEPFVGGGSVFLNSDRHLNYLLADVNNDLISMYQMLSAAPDEVIASAKLMFEKMNTEEDFYAIRTEFNNHCFDGIERAAAFIYLNKHCFNGLMRYNQQYQFNVGYGKYKAPYFPEAEMRKFADMSHNCVFFNAEFSRTLALAGEGDVVYCDPPYEPMPDKTGFTNYSAGGFNWDAQERLTAGCVAAHQRGATVIISNSGSPRIAELYQQNGFILHSVNGRRSISCKGDRARASDILAVLG